MDIFSFLSGPNFNVTVGPNGSGKSTVVTALSVCLGGDLSSLHRQVRYILNRYTMLLIRNVQEIWHLVPDSEGQNVAVLKIFESQE